MLMMLMHVLQAVVLRLSGLLVDSQSTGMLLPELSSLTLNQLIILDGVGA